MKFFDNNGVELKQKVDKQLLEMALPFEVFAEGENDEFRWVATRGETLRWGVYTTTNKSWNSDTIVDQGSVITDIEQVKKLLDVSDDAVEYYD